MLSIRTSISAKLFVAMSLVTTLVIAVLAIVVILNMRSGFTRYLAQAELARFDQLQNALVEAHDLANPGWPQFQFNPRAWNEFVRRAVPPPPRPVGPPPGRRTRPGDADAPNRDVRRPPPPRDPLGFARRLTLLNAEGMQVVGGGGRPDRQVLERRAITDPDRRDNAAPLGWLALTVNPGQLSSGDALFLRDQIFGLLAVSLAALLLSGMAAYFLSNQFLRPIRELAQAGEHLSAGNYEIRLDDTRMDELGALVRQFNALAENLEARDKSERKWISDTSHELKTPLAVLRAQVEALQDGVHKPDAKRLGELHSSIMRLSQLVADLNSLSNMREGHLATSMEKENLSEIIESRIDACLEQISGQVFSVQANVEPGMALICDRLRIGQLLDNLLQNAIRYTDAPGTIKVAASKMPNGIEIVVEDSAPCPDPAIRDRMFNRFFREEASRGRKYGGSGLGLSICREIVSAHQGQISLSPSSLGGLCVRVELPIDGAPDE
ncbi:MAG: ATP-binding protein [Rhizobiaceae bacterium]